MGCSIGLFTTKKSNMVVHTQDGSIFTDEHLSIKPLPVLSSTFSNVTVNV